MSIKKVLMSSVASVFVYASLCFIFGDPMENYFLSKTPKIQLKENEPPDQKRFMSSAPVIESSIGKRVIIPPVSRMNTIDKNTREPQVSWGKLPAGDIKKTYQKRKCGNYFKIKYAESLPMSLCDPHQYLEAVRTNSSLPLIAIMAASTTRGVETVDLDSFSLFNLLLPSLVRSVDCGYRYVFVLGYDVGDPFFDSPEGMAVMTRFVEYNVTAVLKSHGIHMSFRPVRVDNTLKKPGPVFIEIAKVAFHLGAEFMYRVNDDVEFRDKWAKAYATSMKTLSKPYGVFGPFMVGKDNRILTVDFTNRLHMEIFDMNYYPPELVDWWMDDWISIVYGVSRTFRSKNIKAFHHTSTYAQRYTVRDLDLGNKQLMDVLDRGVKAIRRWMVNNGASEHDIAAFDRDNHHPLGKKGGSVLRDIPAWV